MPKALIETQREFRDKLKNSELEVYSAAWFGRIFNSIEEDYEALAWSLGPRAFEELVKSYLKRYPSQSYTLAHAGDRLPLFLETWANAEKKPWHRDLALLECFFYQAFYAEDPKPLAIGLFANRLPEELESLPLAIGKALYLVTSDWKIDSVWRREKRSPSKTKSYFCIYRDGFDVEVEGLSEQESQVLGLLVQGATLGCLLERFPTEETVNLLTKFAGKGLIVIPESK